MSANQSHKNRLAKRSHLLDDMTFDRSYRMSKGDAHRKQINPKFNPAGKAQFRGFPDVAPWQWNPDTYVQPDPSHQARQAHQQQMRAAELADVLRRLGFLQ